MRIGCRAYPRFGIVWGRFLTLLFVLFLSVFLALQDLGEVAFHGTPPPLDDSNAAVRFLSEQFPNSTPQSQIILPDTAAELLRQYEDACEQLEDIAQQKQQAENLLKQMMGENEIGKLENHIVTWKSIAQERLDSKTLKAEHPALYRKYTNRTSYRRFSVRKSA